MVRQSQLKSVSIGFDGRTLVAVFIDTAEEIFKRNRDLGAVSLKRTLLTFFRQKVSARRAGES